MSSIILTQTPSVPRRLLLLLQLSFLLLLSSASNAVTPAGVPCRPDQAAALLRLKRSFAVTSNSVTAFRSWRAGTDCCGWEGVGCAAGAGANNGRAVTSLHLGDWGLESAGIDPALFELTSLEYLNLAYNNFGGSKIPSDGFERLIRLTHLNLSSSGFTGQVPASIGNLTSLVSLDLSTYFMIVEIPDDAYETLISQTANSIWLIEPNFETFISKLTNLRDLHLGYVDMSNSGAQWCDALANSSPNLQVISLPFCSISGPICRSLSLLQSLAALNLQHNNLSGPIPDFLSNLSNLSVLRLNHNELEGWVSPAIFGQKNLVTIDLHHNLGISGILPNFSADSRLEELLVGQTNCSGLIPSSIGNLKFLKQLDLGASGFFGELPSSIGKLESLNALGISGVGLEGPLPSWVANLTSLTALVFSDCGMSKFPIFLRHQYEINGLDLSDNEINGTIPHWAWETWNYISLLGLSGNRFTSVGYDPLLPLQVDLLDLSNNMLEGSIPIPRGSSTSLKYSNNGFSSMPSNFSAHLRDVTFFMADGNEISGNIPLEFCSAKSLQLLDLSYNNFNGSISSCLMDSVSTLQVLNLKGNELHGVLPDDIKEGCSFQALDISGNLIEGKLPRSLVACKNLEVFDVGFNQISDTFPCWMSTLPRLQVIALRSNKFFGQVAQSAVEKNSCEFPAARIIDLASNNFSGPLPQDQWFKKLKSMMIGYSNTSLVMDHEVPRVGRYKFSTTITYKGSAVTLTKILRTFVFIDVSENKFHGSIPGTIGELILLHALNMSHNFLTGPIPSQLGHLNQLEALDMSSNELSGVIPQELASLDFLAILNLSYNKLEGRIPPQSPHFSTFSSISFLGNKGLCGLPLSTGCSNTTSLNVIPSEKNPVDIVLFLSAGLGFGLGFAIAIVVAWGIPIRKRSTVRQRAL
ncbi:Os01g0160600 [Oryza sativa Japonica Group]|uniref:non-specific serine/threonine protein kinase n=1 Tax=Oryza sativa subsp. japonica TaxID=39947 RepID=A0A0N7KCD6_ORYSJ|nr:Os01g0160600 [Oryza sativa Japonica Group]